MHKPKSNLKFSFERKLNSIIHNTSLNNSILVIHLKQTIMQHFLDLHIYNSCQWELHIHIETRPLKTANQVFLHLPLN